MANETIVIDASVALKWLHQEEDSEKALKLLNDIQERTFKVFVPDLLLYEIANVWIRGKGKSGRELSTSLEALLSMPIVVLTPTIELLAEAAEYASSHDGLSVYDATYVAIAMIHDGVVITADKKLHKLVGAPLTKLL